MKYITLRQLEFKEKHFEAGEILETEENVNGLIDRELIEVYHEKVVVKPCSCHDKENSSSLSDNTSEEEEFCDECVVVIEKEKENGCVETEVIQNCDCTDTPIEHTTLDSSNLIDGANDVIKKIEEENKKDKKAKKSKK